MANNNFYQIVNGLLITFGSLRDALTLKFNALSEDDQEWGADNLYDAIRSTENTIRQLKIFANIDRFMQNTPAVVAAQLTAISQGQQATQPYNVITHAKSDFETPRSLEVMYGVPAATILDYNDMTMDEFDAASTVLIPMPANNTNNNVLVVGDQSGTNILGTDIENNATFDPLTNDLKILNTVDTAAQYYQNILSSEKGDIPFYEDIGLPSYAGSDLPTDVVLSMLQQAIEALLTADPLIKTIDAITVTKSGNTVQARSQFHVANNTNPITVTT